MNKHLTKVILRIVVAALILALVGVGIWLIFFRPSDNVSVFNSLTQLKLNEQEALYNSFNDHEEKNNKNETVNVKGLINSNIVKGQAEGSVEINFNNEIADNTSYPTEVLKYRYSAFYRNLIFGNFQGKSNNPFSSTSSALGNTVNVSNVNMQSIYSKIDDVFNNYFNYAQLATGVSGDATKAMNNKISSYKSAIKNFAAKADEILKLQTQIDTTFNSTIVNEIYVAYKDLYTRYFNVLLTYNNLTQELVNFVNRFVFNSNPVYDKNTVSLEINLNTVSELVNKQVIDPVPFVYNDATVTEEQRTAYNNFISFMFDAAVSLNTNKITDEIVQNYADLKNYKGENAATVNAITGSRNIFTLNRTQKAQLIKANPAQDDLVVSDLYYTDNGFGDKIKSVIRAAFM